MHLARTVYAAFLNVIRNIRFAIILWDDNIRSTLKYAVDNIDIVEREH